MGKTQSTLFSLEEKKNLQGTLWKIKYKLKIFQWSCNLERPSAPSKGRALYLILWAMGMDNQDPGHTGQPQEHPELLDLKGPS